jgi:hypothetical protein
VGDIEGKAARVAASECGQRASFKEEGKRMKQKEKVISDE